MLPAGCHVQAWPACRLQGLRGWGGGMCEQQAEQGLPVALSVNWGPRAIS